MQKYKLIYLAILIYFTVNFANDGGVLNLYRTHQMDKIHHLLINQQIADQDWAEFSRLIFEADGDQVFTHFIKLQKKTKDAALKQLIVDRLSQYYYAKGLYSAANRVIDDQGFLNQVSSSQIQKIYFGVQVGAFSTRNNAQKARNKFEKMGHEIYIISKTKKGKKLYTVVLGKFRNRDDAIKMKRKIAKNMHKSSMIIQY